MQLCQDRGSQSQEGSHGCPCDMRQDTGQQNSWPHHACIIEKNVEGLENKRTNLLEFLITEGLDWRNLLPCFPKKLILYWTKKNWLREGGLLRMNLFQDPSCFVFAWGIIFCLPRPAASSLARLPFSGSELPLWCGGICPSELGQGSCVSPGWARRGCAAPRPGWMQPLCSSFPSISSQVFYQCDPLPTLPEILGSAASGTQAWRQRGCSALDASQLFSFHMVSGNS